MSEEAVVESKAPAEVQKEALAMGWIPPERFKKAADSFVDADEYLKRGETVLPIVKAQNKRLAAELATTQEAVRATNAALAVAQKAIAEQEERHTVATQKAVDAAKREVKLQLEKASEAGDHAAVAELTEQMVELNAQPVIEKKNGAEKPAVVQKQEFTPSPEQLAWQEENPWFGVNKRKTALALGIAQEITDEQKETGVRLSQTEFYKRVSKELDAETGVGTKETQVDRVEGARNGSGSDTRQSSKKSYANLPADAKAACKQDAKRFVGEGKSYKTEAEWNARYAELYFAEE